MPADKSPTPGSQKKLDGVTVITPSYNYARFIRQCVESVSANADEILLRHIVQDGLSTDGTAQVLKTLERDNLIFVSERDRGQSDALNKALALVGSNDLVGWLNADEFYLPGAIDFFYQAALSHPEVDVFYGDCIFVDKQGLVLRALPSHRMSRFVLRNYGCFIPSCALFVRASALKKIGWDTSFRRAMDWDLYLTMSKEFKFKYFPYTAAGFRVHDEQVTHVPESQDEKEFMHLREKHGIRKTKARTIAALGLHALLKILDGGYQRQFQVNKLKGRSLT